MSAVAKSIDTTTQVRRPISSIRIRAATHLRFITQGSGALVGVEFEIGPNATVLHSLYAMLTLRQVRIADSAIRMTEDSMCQTFQLSELDGRPLTGARREEVQIHFIEALARVSRE